MKPVLPWLFCLLLLLSACSPSPPEAHESRFMMGTLVEFTVYGVPRAKAAAAIRAAANAMQEAADSLTIYGDVENTVKAFNASRPGVPVQLPAAVSALLTQAKTVERQSHGAFSPVLGSLSLLWGFSTPTPPSRPPGEEDIRRALAGVGPKLLRRLATPAHTWVRLHEQTRLDFGGIGKGYAIDIGIAVLRKHGIEHALINAGGDMRAIGRHGERPWRIGIRHPRQAGAVLATLDLEGDVSVVTSGDYERFFIYRGRRYHHILNPGNGWPADKSQSVTVIAENATLADAWSTALFVLGPKGLELLKKRHMDALLVDAGGDIHTTPGMKKRLK
ncbi:MAG: FAD:protein FMN transferase [Mariprofundaceae bacterium]|nr:FAD:protein FMN transferase [Mariprofundaceae bacterium]